MSTRTGDLDPGVAWYIMQSENLTPKQFKNLINAPVISTDTGQTTVRVIHTDEEWMIAKTVSQIINFNKE